MAEAKALTFKLELPEAAAPGRYRFLGMHGSEALGRLFEFHIRFSSDKAAIDPLKMLGDKVALSMETADGKRHFHAYITAFEFRGPIDLPLPAGADAVPQYQYAVVARPWTWFLTRSSDCRVFQNLKVPEIIGEILDKYPGSVKKQLQGDYQPWEHCVQYRETDFNFVSRLMEQEGVFYFFEHDASDHHLALVDLHGPTTDTKHKIVYVPGARAGRMEKECVYEWCVAHEVQPGAYAIKDFDFKKPTAPQLSVVKRPYKHDQGDLEVFDYPGEFDTTGEGDTYVRVRLDELRTQYETVRAQCNVRVLAAGDVFELSNPEQAGAAAKTKFLVTDAVFDLSSGLESELEGPSYRCSFTCIRSAEQFRPKRLTPKPIVQGPQTATVVGPDGAELHTDNYGRIKVRFHWDRHSKDDKESSCWVRVSHPWAGKNFGFVAIPRINQEVVVDFLEGDPDRPLVTGRVYNQDNMPPWDLPANATQSGVLSRSSKGGAYGNANALRFEDKKGSEQVWLHAEKNQDIEVENDETHWVGHDRTKTIDHDETTHVKHDRTETVDNDETITIHGQRTETVDKDETITIHQNRTETVDKEETITIHGGRTETVDKNESITIHGGRTEKVDKDESITIDGGRTETVAKNESITINGGRTETVAKDESITINGGRTEKVAKDESIGIGGGRTETVGKDESITISGGRTESVAKDESVTVSGGRNVSVGKDDSLNVAKNLTISAGDSVTIKTGSASISMKKDGTIVIKGKDITIDGSGKINVKAGGDVVIKGSKILNN
jgi:type VI secretion system secreted protein VgrG